MRVLVLCGGESAERVVSLASGDAVANWVTQAGHIAAKYDPEQPGVIREAGEDMAPSEIGMVAPAPALTRRFDPTVVRGLLQAIESFRPDLVFPILHGGRGEDGTLQAVLDWIGVRYTGSGPLASALAMNKQLARTMFQASGIPVTEGFVPSDDGAAQVSELSRRIQRTFGFPCVVKPLCGGSTIGLSKVQSADELGDAVSAVRALGDIPLIEAHFAGRELAATVIDGEAFPLVEIRPHEGYYDYANKYTAGRTDYLCPAPLTPDETEAIQSAASRAFRSLGCSGFARVDFLLGLNGGFVCLEVNTLPGMTTHSLVPKAARARGLEPPELIQRIIDCAQVRGVSAGALR